MSEEYIFNPTTKKEHSIGEIEIHIEQQILKILEAGAGSHEPGEIRPLREIIQNADDARADRLVILVTEKALHFYNDGECLTRELMSDGTIRGSQKRINQINTDLSAINNKMDDPSVSGNFGTGLRSAHLFSDSLEIHSILYDLNEKKKEKAKGSYIGTASYNKPDLNEPVGIIADVIAPRSKTNRPKHQNPQREGFTENGCIHFTLKWRRMKDLDANRMSRWGSRTWDKEKITKLGLNYKKNIPSILLGCRHLREVVLSLEYGSEKATYAFSRDFDLDGCYYEISKSTKPLTQSGRMKYFFSDKTYDIKDLFTQTLDSFSKIVTTVDYNLFLEIGNEEACRWATESNLDPHYGIIVPSKPGDEEDLLPVYTPIALAASKEKRNLFAPVGYMPPHESRRYVLLDDQMNPAKILWAHHIMEHMSQKVLPRVFEWLIGQVRNNKMKIEDALKLLPRRKPDVWFCESENGIGEYSINSAWKDYCRYVSSVSFFPGINQNELVWGELIRVDVEDDNLRTVLTELLHKLGETVLTNEQKVILESLSINDWGEEHPMHDMEVITGPVDLKNILSKHKKSLTLKLIGKELVHKMIELVHIKPSKAWKEDEANRNLIPCIPNSGGQLCPLIENNSNVFYLSSDQLPDLLPTNRRIHTDFSNYSKSFNLENPKPEELAKLVDEAVRNDPTKFNDLEKHVDLHRQISMALEIILKKPPNYEMKDYKFIPILHEGKIGTRGMPKLLLQSLDYHVWPVDDFNSNINNFFRREMFLGDSVEIRSKLFLHKVVESKLFWLELHPSVESERQKICNQLKIHFAHSVQPGVNIIRSLIFAQVLPKIDLVPARSVFDKNENGWGLDEWVGKKLSTNQRNDIFESLLNLLKSAADSTANGAMSTGWGADSRVKVHALHLLKNSNDKWSTLDNLCYDLPSDLSKLFGKTAVLESHRKLLGHKIITSEVGAAGGAGLGITHRINEIDIKEKVGKITGATPEVRSKIIGMMLSSQESWDLDPEIGLAAIEWTPTFGTNMRQLNQTILPSPEMVKLLGSNHPWNIITDLDCTSESVQERAKELGINCESEGVEFIHSALLSPETVWPEFEGKDILRHLQNKFNDNNKLITNGLRKPRLPDDSGKWHDDSWLVSSELLDNAKLIFPERNIVTAANIGGTDVATMAKQWILPVPCGPKFNDLVDKLRTMSTLGKTNVDKKELQALWDLISGTPPILLSLSKEETNDFLIIIGSQIIKLGELFITNEESALLIDDEETKDLFPLDESHPLAEILEQTFKVVNLNDCKVSDLHFTISDLKSLEFQSLSIQRYWVILASLASRFPKLINEEVWLLISATGYSFTKAKPEMVQTRKALIPEIDDSRQNIKRMSEKKLSLLWLPRSGLIQSTIYDGLERTSAELPFLRKIARPKTASFEDGDKEDWPVLTIALQNILDAIILTENGAYPNINTAKVFKTTEPISSELYAKTAAGTPEVFWKQSNDTESMYLSVNQSEGSFELIISVKDNKLDDEMIIHHLCKNIVKFNNNSAKEMARKLVSRDESRWVDFSSILNHEEHRWTETARPLITTGIYKEFSENMENWYGGCQVCGQQTPADRIGGFQESVVSLFKEQGGRYYSDSIGYHQGNVMYLCPVHKSLYSRSKYSDLMWIPDLDDAKEQIDKTPTKEKLKEIIDSVLGTTGELTLEVKTYEKTPGDQETGPSEKTNKVRWNKKHARSFRDALTQYLTGLLN